MRQVRQKLSLRIHRNTWTTINWPQWQYWAVRHKNWIDPIQDFTFQSFHVLQLGWWQFYDFLTNSMIMQYTTRNLRNAIDRDRKSFISKQYLDDIWWSRVIENSATTLRRKRNTFHYSMTRRQIPVITLFTFPMSQRLWTSRESTSKISQHKRFTRSVRMTGKVFPYLSINHVTKIIRYYGSSERRVK